jgi:hypothetical protein
MPAKADIHGIFAVIYVKHVYGICGSAGSALLRRILGGALSARGVRNLRADTLSVIRLVALQFRSLETGRLRKEEL